MYPQNRGKVNPYLIQKIMSARPEQLISYIYDAAIAGCVNKDRAKASRAVQELINSLNFEYKEIAITFFNVYRHINFLIRTGKFETARNMLTEIKKSWSDAMKVA